QQPRRPHVGARQSHLGEEKGDLRRLRGDADVARRRDDCAGAGDRAVQGADDRPAAAPHRENQVAGELRELVERVEIAAQEGADDVLHVTARAERPSRAGDHDRAYARFGVERTKCVAQLFVDLECQRIESLGPIERYGRDGCLLVQLITDNRRPNTHSTATASISTNALESTSDFTSTTAIAG